VSKAPPLFERVAAARTDPRAAAQTGVHVRPLVRKPVEAWKPRRHRLGGVRSGGAVDDGGVGRMARSTERPYRSRPWAQQREADGAQVRDGTDDSTRPCARRESPLRIAPGPRRRGGCRTGKHAPRVGVSRLGLGPQIDWNIKSRIWENIIVTPDGRMIGRTEAYTLAEDLIAYLLAPEKMSEDGKEKLKVNYNKARGYNYAHPDGREAEELPLAVKAPAAA
jgi:hypothetical protein